jgi:hypothetical protein
MHVSNGFAAARLLWTMAAWEGNAEFNRKVMKFEQLTVLPVTIELIGPLKYICFF